MKKTMTLNLNDEERAVLTKLAKEKGISKTAVMRQALRLYQLVVSKKVKVIDIFKDKYNLTIL